MKSVVKSVGFCVKSVKSVGGGEKRKGFFSFLHGFHGFHAKTNGFRNGFPTDFTDFAEPWEPVAEAAAQAMASVMPSERG